MSTPKPGQIRCPTCLRSTPPAAFCTQCGSPIPQSARARPRGMDRDELEERVRRRPGEGGFRRGTGGEAGYVPFQPEPEDSLALRRRQEAAAARRVDNLPAEQEQQPKWPDEDREEVVVAAPLSPPPETTPPPVAPSVEPEREPEPEYDYPPEAYDDTPYGRPEDAYAYPYYADERRRGGGGGGALPIIGFVVLCVLALGVGAVLAGLLGGDDPAAQASPSASVEASAEASGDASTEPSAAASASAGEATPQPSDGPVAFPDGALMTIQPCDTNEFRPDAVGNPEEIACEVDGSSVSDGSVWAVVVFSDTAGADMLEVLLRSGGETIDEQEAVLSSKVDCAGTCSGLVYGAAYQGLEPGDYELVLNRNGEFADVATFVVEG